MMFGKKNCQYFAHLCFLILLIGCTSSNQGNVSVDWNSMSSETDSFQIPSEFDNPVCFELQGVFRPGAKLDSNLWKNQKRLATEAAYRDLSSIDDMKDFEKKIDSNLEKTRWWATEGGYSSDYYDLKKMKRIHYEYDNRDSLRFESEYKMDKKADVCVQFISNRAKLYECDSPEAKGEYDGVWDTKFYSLENSVSFECSGEVWRIKKFNQDSLVFEEFERAHEYSSGLYKFKRTGCVPLGKFKGFFSKCIRFSMRWENWF